MKYWILISAFLLVGLVAYTQESKLVLPVGHTNYVLSSSFSPDGKRIVTASMDGTSKIWDPNTGQKLIDLSGHKGFVTTARFSPDGKKIVTASYDHSVKIWDSYTGQLLADCNTQTSFVNRPGLPISASFSPDGKKIVTATYDNTAKIWDANTGQMLADLRKHTDLVITANFSPDGKKIVTTSKDKTANIWDANNGKLLSECKGHKNWLFSASFSPDGKKIVTGSWDGTAKIWDANTGKLLKDFKGHTGFVLSANFSPDGEKIVTASQDGTAKIWDVNTGQILADCKGHTGFVFSANFSPDGMKVVTASADKTCKIWDVSNGQILTDCKGHTGEVVSASYSPDGKKIVTVSQDGTAKIWDGSNAQLLEDLKGHTTRINAVTFNQTGKKIVTAARDNTAKIWDANSGQLLAICKGHTDWISSVIFSPDENKIVTVSQDGTAKIWNPNTGQLLVDISGHKGLINTARFSPDGKKLVTTSEDKTAKIWDVNSGQLLVDITGHIGWINSARFSPDGKKLVTASGDKTAKIWDVNTGQMLLDCKEHTSEVWLAIFNPDGKRIVTISEDSTTKIWDANTGQQLTDFFGQNDLIYLASFSRDGKKMVTASKDTTVKIWDCNNGQMLASLSGQTNFIYSVFFFPDGKKVVTYSRDSTKIWDAATGSLLQAIPLGLNTYVSDISFFSNRMVAINNSEVKLFSLSSGEQLLSFFAIDSTDWTVLHPSGLFDASPGAMDKMYWVKGDEVIEFNQLKDRYWQPGLWKMIMDGKQLRSVQGMNELKMQPLVDLSPLKGDTLTIQLTKRDGGYGRVSILVNNKEVIHDARPANFDTSLVRQQIMVDLKEYLVPGMENNISVQTQSADGFVTGRGIGIIENRSSGRENQKPAFYAIICGTGEYSNPTIQLKYAVPDANAMATALQVGAEKLFGKDSTHVYLLSNPGKTPTTKKNIQQTFEAIRKQAKPEDVILVYLSGHGVTYGGEKGDFYYLTAEASSSNAEGFSDPQLRAMQGISTEELTQWLNACRALKQVMVIDACGSGKAVDNLIAKRDLDPSQIKAIDRMKDRTGLYVISGCAADAVSYEASRYGQGLLTYSLLQAMKGAALKENKYLDVVNWLSYARDQVPKMAEGIGGIQQPQLLLPKSGSFDMGILDENDKSKIPLASIKPVYVRATLFEDNKKRDVWKISSLLNQKLNDISAKGTTQNGIVYFDTDEFPDACSISGAYTINGDKLNFTGSLLCGKQEKPLQFMNLTKEELVDAIVKSAIPN